MEGKRGLSAMSRLLAPLLLLSLAKNGLAEVGTGVLPTRQRDLRGWLHDFRHSPREVLTEVRQTPELRKRACAALGFAIGICVVPRTRGPDYNSFRTAEGWRQRLLSIKPVPLPQRILMSLPFALALAFAADPRGNLEIIQTRVDAKLARLWRRKLQ
jgi:hypothetical protein